MIDYVQIWNKKEHDILCSNVISIHMSAVYIERPYNNNNENNNTQYNNQRIDKVTRVIGNKNTSEDKTNNCTKIDQNTEKYPWGEVLSLKLQLKTIS